MCQAVRNFLTGWKDEIQTIANLATVIVAIVAIWLSKEELRQSASSTTGAVLYQSLRDLREVSASYSDGKASESEVFATMQTIYLQQDMIPAVKWPIFDRDFCLSFEDEHLRNAWKVEPKRTYWNEFVKYIDGIATQAEAQCK